MMRNSKGIKKKTQRPKMKLGLLDSDHSKSAVLDSLPSPEPQRGYRHSTDEFIAAWRAFSMSPSIFALTSSASIR